MDTKKRKTAKPTFEALRDFVRSEATIAAREECQRLREVILQEVRGMLAPTPDDSCITITVHGRPRDSFAGRWLVNRWETESINGRLTLSLERPRE